MRAHTRSRIFLAVLVLGGIESSDTVPRMPVLVDREKLLFGKGTYQPKAGQTVDVSYSLRTESDVRGFGSQTSFEAAENVENRVDSVLGRWLVPGHGWLNEFTATWQRSRWNPQPLNPDLVGLDSPG